MTEIFDRIALVADERAHILVEQTGDGFRLPRWEPSEIVYGHVVGPLNRALRRDLGLEVTTLRYLGRCRNAATGRNALVDEMEWHNTGWQPPATYHWVSHDEWLPLRHAEEERPFVEAWFTEAESGILPPQRAPWAIRGWHEEAVGWFSAQARRLGFPLTGRVEQERAWGISTVLRAPAGDTNLYFKASGTVFHAEPAITLALSTVAPDHLPVVLAEDTERAWMVLADFGGSSLQGTAEPSSWDEALREYARLQISCIGHEDRLLAAGARDRRLWQLPSDFARLVHTDAALMPGHPKGLSWEQTEEVRSLIPWLEEVCEQLSRAGVPQSFVHGDLHAGNVAMTSRGPVFFDWSDAAFSHPFFDLVPFIDEGFEGPDMDMRDRVRDAYLEPWAALAAPEGLRETFDLGQTAGAAYHAVSYWMIVESLEQSSKPEAQNAVPHFLRRLLDHYHATQR